MNAQAALNVLNFSDLSIPLPDGINDHFASGASMSLDSRGRSSVSSQSDEKHGSEAWEEIWVSPMALVVSFFVVFARMLSDTAELEIRSMALLSACANPNLALHSVRRRLTCLIRAPPPHDPQGERRMRQLFGDR